VLNRCEFNTSWLVDQHRGPTGESDAIIRSTRADTRAGPLALLDSLRMLLDDYDSMRRITIGGIGGFVLRHARRASESDL
jgi:hypothetical protein